MENYAGKVASHGALMFKRALMLKRHESRRIFQAAVWRCACACAVSFASSAILLVDRASAEQPQRRSPASSSAQAQPEGKAASEKKPERELPKSGVLSSSYATGGSGRDAPIPWGQDENMQDNAPLSGSVSRRGAQEWVARVFNNSEEDTYSLSASVTQNSLQGKRVKRDSFSVTLAPGKSAERVFRSAPSGIDATLTLESWKKLKSKKAEATPTAPPA